MKEYCLRREKWPRQERRAGKSTTDMVSTSTVVHGRRANPRQADTRWRLPAAGRRPARTVHAEQRGIDPDGRGRRNPGKRLPGASWPGRTPLSGSRCAAVHRMRVGGCPGVADRALNGEARWRTAAEVMAPVGPELAPYEPPRRCFVVDERHVGAEDLPGANLMKAVPGLDRAIRRGTWCGWRGRPVEWLRDPRMTRG